MLSLAYVYLYTYIHICTCVHIYMYTHMLDRRREFAAKANDMLSLAHAHLCKFINLYTYIHVYIYVSPKKRTCGGSPRYALFAPVGTCTFIYIYIYVYIHIYIHIKNTCITGEGKLRREPTKCFRWHMQIYVCICKYIDI